jgi:uncharacterized membrane protein
MIEIVPNWHPFLVHFTLGLLLTAAALFAAGALLTRGPIAAQATMVARWNLWIGTAFAVITVAAGYRAYYTVAHDDPAHAAMLIHLKWAWVALAWFITAAILAWRERSREMGASIVLAIILVAGTGALLVTAYLGADNVYRHGLGVMRLPAAEGPGHAHEHGDAGPSHDHSAAPSPAQGSDTAGMSPAATTAAAAVDAFQDALATGDLEGARQLLDPGVRIFESGGVERSAEEYASHHLKSDAAFLYGADVTLRSRSGDVAGDLAWIASESAITRNVDGNPLSIVSTETMILRDTPEGWRITHIHWSSRPFDGDH